MRQHISLLFRLISWIILLMLPGGLISARPVAAGGDPPATLTLVSTAASRHIVSVQPGFTLFIVFPVPIEFVAIGDETLLAVAVRAPSGVVALKATHHLGRTNMHVQAGGIVTIFEVRISTTGRSADVVRVVLEGVGVAPGHPTVGAFGAGSTASISLPSSGLRGNQTAGSISSNPDPDAGAEKASSGSTFLRQAEIFRVVEIQEQGILASFQAYRTAGGIEIRYELANTSGGAWRVADSRVLVRADGKIIGPRLEAPLGEESTAVLGEGETRHGRLLVGGPADTIELLFPLFPLRPDPRRLPVQFNVRFDGMNSLVEVNPK